MNSEPAMYLQRPTSEKSQDISHIFSSTFRELFCKDAVPQNTVKNLAQSRSGRPSYHEHYAERLQQIQEKWEKEIEIIENLESHLITAKETARQMEKEKTESARDQHPGYENLGLPPVASHLSACLHTKLLRSLNLIVPEDFIQDKSYENLVAKPQDESLVPQYAKPTTSSRQRHRKTPPEDNYREEMDGTVPPAKFSAEILRIDRTGERQSRLTGADDSVHGVRSDVKIRGKPKVWKSSMKPQQREVERIDLSRLQERADFLKNPRFDPRALQKKASAKINEERTQANVTASKINLTTDIFVATPHPVRFTDYHPGKVYEVVLKLKNVTNASRQLRVLPPSTSYFSVGLGQFPSENGIVAPGMCCQYTVYFSPDSLADFDDAIQVITLASDPIIIPLEARRLPPNLTLPELFDCGYTLANTTKVLLLQCYNSGGPGRFCILPRSKWPCTEWEHSLDSPGAIELDGFHFEPAMCQLNHEESVTFKVTFSPTKVKTYKETIVFICDNCQIKSFGLQGVGELAGVEFVSIEGDLSEHDLCESRDISSEYFVRFKHQHPKSIEKRELKIRNTTAVPLAFYWVLAKPRFGKKDEVVPQTLPREATSEKTSFSIVPRSGELAANTITSFDVIFQSTEVGVFHNILTLVLKEIPTNNSDLPNNLSDVRCLSLELKGESSPYQVLISPPALVIPGECLMSTTFHYTIMMANSSEADAKFLWPVFETDQCLVTFSPESGILGPKEKIQVDIYITGKRPEQVQQIIPCQVPYAQEAVYLYLDMAFCGPRVDVQPKILDFGLVRHGYKQTREVVLYNHSSIPAQWSIARATDNINSHSEDFLSIGVESGTLEPMEEQVISVTIDGVYPVILKSYYKVIVKDSQNRYLKINANVQRPCVCFLSSTLAINECYVDIPVVKVIQLYNKTLLVSEFRFAKIVGADAEAASVSFKPEAWILKPRECLNIEVTFSGKRQGEIKDLIAIFVVQGSAELVPLNIEVDVKGLSVEYSIPDNNSVVEGSSLDDESPLVLDFGRFVNIGSNPEGYLLLRNQSAIPTTFEMSVEYFCVAEEDSVTDKGKGLNTGSNTKRPVLSKIENAPDAGSTPIKRMEAIGKSYLKNNKGACFLPKPSKGKLDPFGQQLIIITAFSDMWGDYSDNLRCKVHQLPDKLIPLKMNVVGSPLNLQISKEQPSIIRFGTHLSGSEVVRRKLRVNNTSPCDIRAHWEPYVLDFSDTQLIDLTTHIGKPFPLYDASGCEIEDPDVSGPLIRVYITEHQGKQTEQPFDVQPKQMVIPARGHAVAEALFYPVEGIRAPTDFIGYALGYMCLQKQDMMTENRCVRSDGENVLPFSINMTGALKPARIFIESDEDSGFNFDVPVSNLLEKANSGTYQLQENWLKHHRMMMRNSTGAKLKLSISSQDPFQVSIVDRSQKKKGKQCEDEKSICLEQGQNVQINVSFTLTPKLVEELAEIAHAGDKEEAALKSFGIAELARKFIIEFSNGTTQMHNLSARLIWPSPQLSVNQIDFGICFVGQPQEKYISLSNNGGAGYHWITQNDPSYPQASQSAFKVLPSMGFLESAHKAHENKNKQYLSVMFNPRQNVQYESQVLFLGQLYEPVLVLHLQGTGSFDQANEKQMNIV